MGHRERFVKNNIRTGGSPSILSSKSKVHSAFSGRLKFSLKSYPVFPRLFLECLVKPEKGES